MDKSLIIMSQLKSIRVRLDKIEKDIKIIIEKLGK